MRYSECEIVEDILEHIRHAGGELSDWRVGTFTDTNDPLFRQFSDGSPDELMFREAYTTFAAEEVVGRLTGGFDLAPATKVNANGARARHPGKVVFVYRSKAPVAGARADSHSECVETKA